MMTLNRANHGQGFRILKEHGGYMLLKGSDDGRRTVVQVSNDGRQVFNAMPNDGPTGGGRWFAPFTAKGVAYVANWYSPSWANRVFRRLTLACPYCDSDGWEYIGGDTAECPVCLERWRYSATYNA
jgi:hypothetical protein